MPKLIPVADEVGKPFWDAVNEKRLVLQNCTVPPIPDQHRCYEVGRALNPALVEGQITGGTWMGMSHALYETTAPYYPETDHAPDDFSHYLMPGAAELPEIESTILEIPSANGPFGMKGVGEMTANSPIPAIANAVTDAIGVQITELPITPEKILRALDEAA